MKIGDTLVYGDGSRARIEGFPKINGQPGVLLKPDEKPLMLSDTMCYQHKIDVRVAQGVWSIEPGG